MDRHLPLGLAVLPADYARVQCILSINMSSDANEATDHMAEASPQGCQPSFSIIWLQPESSKVFSGRNSCGELE
jgi:hypothetical protein